MSGSNTKIAIGRISEERDGREIGYGDKLNKEQWEFLTTKTFHGYDVDPEMVRLALMNLILHGIEGAHVA